MAKAPTHPCDRHGIPSYTDDAGTVHIATGGKCTGPDRLPAPIAPDPERDRRRAAYQERERRRAARALDRYLETMRAETIGSPAGVVAGDRFVEAVGDYVLSRLDETDRNARAYGWEVGHGTDMSAVVDASPDNPFLDSDWRLRAPHNRHYGATPSDEETHALDHWNRGVVRPGCRYCDADPYAPPHPTCVETTTYDEASADGRRTWMCGPECPLP